jgi:group I intron endonuclease
MTKITGVYRIQNVVDGRVYVGSGINVKRRFRDHYKALQNGQHANKHLQRAWDKYGGENFEFSVILLCGKDDLLSYEQYYIDSMRACEAGYNICQKAGNTLGRKHSDDTREKIRLRAIGREYGPCSEDRRRKISEAHKGKKQSVEHNRRAVEGRRRNNSYNQTEESKNKISRTLTGKQKPEGFGEKVSMAMRGVPKSPEHRKHLSEARKLFYIRQQQAA